MTHCPLCEEFIGPDDETSPITVMDPVLGVTARRMHRECALRNVIGGIGHLTDHYLWCTINKDPDGGMTYRASAILVDKWVRERGVS
jgi:hypothetical protein